MVATAGAGWRLAPCLKVLFDEADRRKPTRSRAADGTIGDAAHSSRTSDHNPASGWVCAGDVDDDGDSSPVLGVDLLIAHLVATKDRRVKYVIRNGRIWSADRGWRTYTGTNAHAHHVHISVWNTSTARNDLRPWWPARVVTPPKEIPDMDATDKAIAAETLKLLRALVPNDPRSVIVRGDDVGKVVAEGTTGSKPAAELWRWTLGLVQRDPVAIAGSIPDDLAEQVVDILTQRLAT